MTRRKRLLLALALPTLPTLLSSLVLLAMVASPSPAEGAPAPQDPSQAAPAQTAPPQTGPPEAGPPEDRPAPDLEGFRQWYLQRYRRAPASPCSFGRAISLLPACTTPEQCAAYQAWLQRMPHGPMAAVPLPEKGLPNLPAGGPAAKDQEPPQAISSGAFELAPDVALQAPVRVVQEIPPQRRAIWPGMVPCPAGR